MTGQMRALAPSEIKLLDLMAEAGADGVMQDQIEEAAHPDPVIETLGWMKQAGIIENAVNPTTGVPNPKKFTLTRNGEKLQKGYANGDIEPGEEPKPSPILAREIALHNKGKPVKIKKGQGGAAVAAEDPEDPKSVERAKKALKAATAASTKKGKDGQPLERYAGGGTLAQPVARKELGKLGGGGGVRRRS